MECSRRDVRLDELLVDDVHNSRDQGLDVLGARSKGLNIGCAERNGVISIGLDGRFSVQVRQCIATYQH